MRSSLSLEAYALVILITSTAAIPVVDLESARYGLDKRETACIALGNCPGMNPPKESSNTPTPTPTPAPTPIPTPSSPPPSSIATPPGSSSAPPPNTTPLPIASGLQGPDPTLSIERAQMSPYLYGCNSIQKKKVQTAWSEAGQLADAHVSWKPPGYIIGGSYQPAMDMYIGTDSKNDNPLIGTGPLKKNILRQQGIHKPQKRGHIGANCADQRY